VLIGSPAASASSLNVSGRAARPNASKMLSARSVGFTVIFRILEKFFAKLN